MRIKNTEFFVRYGCGLSFGKIPVTIYAFEDYYLHAMSLFSWAFMSDRMYAQRK